MRRVRRNGVEQGVETIKNARESLVGTDCRNAAHQCGPRGTERVKVPRGKQRATKLQCHICVMKSQCSAYLRNEERVRLRLAELKIEQSPYIKTIHHVLKLLKVGIRIVRV